MKFLRIMSLVSLVGLSGTAVQVYGQEKREEKQPDRQQAQPKQQAQPQQRQPQEQPAQQTKQQAQPRQQQKAEAPRPATAAKPQQQRQQPEAARPATAAKPQEREKPNAGGPAVKPQQRQQQESARPATAAKPQQQQQHVQRAQQQQPARAGNPVGHQSGYNPPVRSNQQAQAWQKQASWRPQGSWQGHATWQQDRSTNWQSDHRTWAQRGGYGGYYIPQDSFGLHFGAAHWFRIQSQPIIVAGYPQFQYGGYTFMMVDPWPQDWALNWYATDDVYVGYDNGYYLYNRMHPGEAIAITVAL